MTEVDWGARAQRAAEQHVHDCIEAEESASDGVDVASPASEPFCDCLKCIIRETLYAAWPVIEEALRDGDYQRRVEALERGARTADAIVTSLRQGRQS